MTTVIDSYPSDSDGYTHFFCRETISGLVVATVEGLEYDYTGPPDLQGTPVHQKGDPVTTIIVGLDEQREFEIPGTILSLEFPDGTTWTPGD